MVQSGNFQNATFCCKGDSGRDLTTTQWEGFHIKQFEQAVVSCQLTEDNLIRKQVLALQNLQCVIDRKSSRDSHIFAVGDL